MTCENNKCFERLAVLETNQNNMTKQNEKIIEKLDVISPLVKENSWWIERIKLGFVLLAFSGLGLGVIRWVIS